tara:strand:- start:112 stop:405 length:294 start_codon:yes stop_codon:yes gene_type:complete
LNRYVRHIFPNPPITVEPRPNDLEVRINTNIAGATKISVIADPTAAFPPPRNGKSTSGKVTNVPLPIKRVVTYCDQEIRNVNKLATRSPDDIAGKVT